jgi:hypothetical protein
MKKIVCILVTAIIVPFFTLAQEQLSSRKHEIGVIFNNFDNFGMVYKTGKKSTLFRARLLALNLMVSNTNSKKSDTIEGKSSGYGAGVLAGFEKRIPVVKNLNFVAGLDAGVHYTFSKWNNKGYIYPYGEDIKRWTISPTVSAVIGFVFTIKDALVISAELFPSVSYSYTSEKGTSDGTAYELTNKGLNFGFTNSAAGITIAYRFGK